MSRPGECRAMMEALVERCREGELSEAEAVAIAIACSSLVRSLGFYCQVWLPQDVRDCTDEELTPDEVWEVLMKMDKYDDAAMSANADLMSQLTDDVVASREEGGAS